MIIVVLLNLLTLIKDIIKFFYQKDNYRFYYYE